MSYQVLARKWRPATFEQMVGQSHVLHALTNALTQQRLHHAYLFTGTRGVGKTSLARLFAKGLNCETGVTASPCGVCGSCVEIAQGRFVDLIEVDAASRTKVDDTRELLDNVQYRPTRGRFKVYLIDEVHMLSRSSFNALLKTLEEPPEHVKFLLATTDPQKLPVTVLSRCLQFNLKSLTQQEIGTQLQHILTQEQLPFEHEALGLLAKSANGSMRDALSLTDQAIAFGGGTVMLNQVQSMLGSIDEQHVLGLLKALTDADIGALMQSCAQVLAYGADAQEVLRSLLELLHQITLTQFAPAAAQQSLYSAQIQAFAEQLAPEQVQLYYQILLTGRKDLPHAPDPKSGLEMALLRAVAFVPEKSVKRWQVDDAVKVDLSAQPALTPQATIPPEVPAERQLAVNAPVAEKKTLLATVANPEAQLQAETTPETALEDDEPELNAALIAEQQVILSQAQSQGFGASADPVVSSNTALNQDVNSSDPTDPDTALTEQTATEDVLDAQNTAGDLAPEPYVAEAYGQYDYAQSNDAQSNYAQFNHAQSYDTSTPLDAYQDDYAHFMSEDAAEQLIISEHAVEQLSASEGNLFSNGSAQHSASNQTGQVFAVDNTQVAKAAVSLEDDDILSAVLAARESLLSDLDALSTKDGDGKKLSPDVKAKTPTSNAHSRPATSVNVSPRPGQNAVTLEFESDFELPFDDDFEAEIYTKPELSTKATNAPLAPLSTRPITHSIIVPSTQQSAAAQHLPLDPNDRPPWEDAPVAECHHGNAEPITTSRQVNEESHLRQESAALHAPLLAVEPVQVAPALTLPTNTQAAQVEQAAGQSHQLNHPDEVPATPPRELDAAAPPAPASDLTVAQSITGHPLDLHWYKLMASLDIGGRVRQLAVNSICQVQSNPLPLLLKPDQKHLAAQVAIEQLEQALTAALGAPRQVEVVIGTDPSRETPLELRKRFHQELLQQARQSLIMDDNVQWLINRFGAELENDSLLYPPELLNQRSGLIPALPEPE
ncbi:DNA polymerase III subunit gamma/tau [Shewanella oneidensis]|uniref:DNA-directed DNA polymerase n=1 Tax=Shewanella oneidensis (strain ATCC 700550 / JCM 31522 / CIP 106686 / LMG 19005 / NCIMB 14063 / MR-1) TaxID=211586 RepID=Q8EFG0_SHEON|nr:DNA polymerase III subunit gamma/tau [Shewanella oneidensis]AAN55063.1 DNA polymerase III gamma and tau subunits DnaX [Shewanella oneidensis MR-1]